LRVIVTHYSVKRTPASERAYQDHYSKSQTKHYMSTFSLGL